MTGREIIIIIENPWETAVRTLAGCMGLRTAGTLVEVVGRISQQIQLVRPWCGAQAPRRTVPTYDENGCPSPCNLCDRVYCDHPWDGMEPRVQTDDGRLTPFSERPFTDPPWDDNPFVGRRR